jgi:hypothetical protein
MYVKVCLAILAFVIYGFGVLSLRQERHSRWFDEASFSLAAAVSYSDYGTPLGMTEKSVYDVFRNSSEQAGILVQEAMIRTASGGLPAGNVLKAGDDGIGASYPIFASLSMRLLGVRLSSLTYSFLLLMGFSTLAFISRFRDERLFMVPLLFFALTLMLLSSLTSDQRVMDQVPIGGYRYFTIAGILPALHILFELTDQSRRESTVISDFILLGLQALVLTFVMLVRSSAGYLLGPIVLAALYRIWTNQRNLPMLRLFGKIGFATVLGAVFVSVTAASVPDYGRAGRFLGNFWHRAFDSLHLHPDWPFGTLSEVYDCKDVIPGGLSRKFPDRDGSCVFWSSYRAPGGGKLTLEEVGAHLFDDVYEKVLRSAFFNVVLTYPREVIALYLYYKSIRIFDTLRNAVHFDTSTYSATTLALAALQCGVFVAFVAWGAYRRTKETRFKSGIIIFVLFAFSLLPLYAAFSNLATSVDTIAFMYAGTALVVGGLVLMTIEKVFRAFTPTQNPKKI